MKYLNSIILCKNKKIKYRYIYIIYDDKVIYITLAFPVAIFFFLRLSSKVGSESDASSPLLNSSSSSE